MTTNSESVENLTWLLCMIGEIESERNYWLYILETLQKKRHYKYAESSALFNKKWMGYECELIWILLLKDISPISPRIPVFKDNSETTWCSIPPLVHHYCNNKCNIYMNWPLLTNKTIIKLDLNIRSSQVFTEILNGFNDLFSSITLLNRFGWLFSQVCHQDKTTRGSFKITALATRLGCIFI